MLNISGKNELKSVAFVQGCKSITHPLSNSLVFIHFFGVFRVTESGKWRVMTHVHTHNKLVLSTSLVVGVNPTQKHDKQHIKMTTAEF